MSTAIIIVLLVALVIALAIGGVFYLSLIELWTDR